MNQCEICGYYGEDLTCVLIRANDEDGVDDAARMCPDCLDNIMHDPEYAVSIADSEDYCE